MALGRGLVFLAFLVGALAMTGFGWTMYQNEQFDVQQAVEVEGTVESTDVEQIGTTGGSDDSGSIEYEAVVRYTYTYEGQEYTSESVYPGPEKRFGLEEDARAVANQYSPGQTVTVYVNREDPSRAFLIEETGGNLLPYLLMGIGAILALVFGAALGQEIVGGLRSDVA